VRYLARCRRALSGEVAIDRGAADDERLGDLSRALAAVTPRPGGSELVGVHHGRSAADVALRPRCGQPGHGGTVSVINAATNTVIETIAVDPSLIGAVDTSPIGMAVAVDPANGTAYVTNSAAGTVSVIIYRHWPIRH